MFLLYQNEDKLLQLPTSTTFNVEDIEKKYNHIFKDLNVEIKYKGYIENGNDFCLILEYKTINYHFVDNNNNNNIKWIWALSSEIINYKKVLNYDIDYSVTDFFLNNIKLLFVYDKKGIPYECPIVCFFNHKNININININNHKNIAALCIQRATLYAAFGPYYYFDQNAVWSNDIVRFAIFTGKMKVLLSDTKNNDDWINENYDSVRTASSIVVKMREQQVPLSSGIYTDVRNSS
jgi:hypothetical protein